MTIELIRKIEQRIHRYRILREPKTKLWKAPRKTAQDSTIGYIFEGESTRTLLGKIRLKQHKIFQNILPRHRILIKINLNSSCPYPASTDPQLLGAIVDLLRDHGNDDIRVGDCSGLGYLPTRQVAQKTNIHKALKGKAVFEAFDHEKWVKIAVNGKYLKHITVPECLYEADRIINLANLKTHSLADFSMGIKLLVGFMHPFERYALHKGRLHEKIAEMGRVIQPDLSIIDARKVFITGGPDTGDIAQGDRIFVGDNLLQTDVEAYRFLYDLKRSHNCLQNLKNDPFDMPQFKAYRAGAQPKQTWTLV